MIRLTAIAALLLAAAPAVAQDGATQGEPPARIRSVLLKPGEKCPEATSPDEVVVCGSLENPFRIPRRLRESKFTPASNSWANRYAALDDASRGSSGIPGTCSSVGSGGFTGCSLQAIRRWAEERQAAKREAEAQAGGR